MFKRAYVGNKEINKIFLGNEAIIIENDIEPPIEKTWVEWGWDSKYFLTPYYTEYDTQQNLTDGQVVMQMKITVRATAACRIRFLEVDGSSKSVSLGLNALVGKTYIIRAKYISGEFQLWLQIDNGPDEYKVTTDGITTSYLCVAHFASIKTLHFWTITNK